MKAAELTGVGDVALALRTDGAYRVTAFVVDSDGSMRPMCKPYSRLWF